MGVPGDDLPMPGGRSGLREHCPYDGLKWDAPRPAYDRLEPVVLQETWEGLPRVPELDAGGNVVGYREIPRVRCQRCGAETQRRVIVGVLLSRPVGNLCIRPQLVAECARCGQADYAAKVTAQQDRAA